VNNDCRKMWIGKQQSLLLLNNPGRTGTGTGTGGYRVGLLEGLKASFPFSGAEAGPLGRGT